MRRLRVHVDHSTAGRLDGAIRNAGIAVHDVAFGPDEAVLRIAVPVDAVERTVADLASWSQGAARHVAGEIEWTDV
nr:DUF1949 domain-containing protein [Phytoactinopolyspora mesophila]